MAAAIYAACREMGTPRTLNDIMEENIARIDRLLVFELSLKVPNIDIKRCIFKVAGKASVTENTKRQALSIMKEIGKKQISAGKDPMGLAATTVYAACLRPAKLELNLKLHLQLE